MTASVRDRVKSKAIARPVLGWYAEAYEWDRTTHTVTKAVSGSI